MAKVAVLGFACGFRKDDPGISNCAMMEALRNRYPHLMHELLILQHELAACLKEGETSRVYVIREHRNSGQYLDTDEVLAQGLERAAEEGVTELYILTHPFIHPWFIRFLLWKMVVMDDVELEFLRTGWIPFDPLSEQWYTRSAFNLVLYAIGRLFGRKGK